MTDVSGRLSKLEGAYDALKVVRPMTLAVVAVLLTAAIGTTAFLGAQVAALGAQVGRLGGKIDAEAQRLNEKLDAVPKLLAEEFRAMRAEMSAQTSAIANAVTAARQAPPQVLLVPAPLQPPPVSKP